MDMMRGLVVYMDVMDTGMDMEDQKIMTLHFYLILHMGLEVDIVLVTSMVNSL